MTGLLRSPRTASPPSTAGRAFAPWATWGLAVLLGAAGLLLNSWRVQLLTEETPDFVFGGVMVLLSFLLLGSRPGLLTGLIALWPIVDAGARYYPALALAVPVYLLEAWATVRLHRWLGSLVFASAVFWYGAGWLLDALVYGGGMGLPRDYVILLFVKQVFNGLINAAFAELVVALPALRQLRWPQPVPWATSLQGFVFRRAALVVMAPAVGLSLLTSRALFERHLELEGTRELREARRVAAALVHDLDHRHRELLALARGIEWGSLPSGARGEPALAAFLAAHPGLGALALTDAEGSIVAAATSQTGAAGGSTLLASGLAVADHPFFARARERLAVAYGSLQEGGTSASDPRGAVSALAIAEPVLATGGRFAGVVVGVLDPSHLAAVLTAGPSADLRVTIVDAGREVLATTSPELARRGSLPPEVAEHLAGDALERTFSYFPAPNRSRESRLRIDLRHAALYRLPEPPLAVLVELPALSLHAALLPLAWQVLGFLLLTLVLLYAVVASFGRRVSAPLAVLETASREIARGSFPPARLLARLGDSPISEIRSLAADFSRMQHALAYHDAITGLPNRQLFADILSQAVSRAAGDGGELAVLVIDLDGFRALQESLGPDGTARLVKKVSARLEDCLPDDGAAGRLGPDVFALAAPAPDACAAAGATIEAVQGRLRRPFLVEGREVFVTASVGASLYPADGHDVEALLHNATAAMERVKEQGKDGATLFSPELAGRNRERLHFESDLRRAWERGELGIHYQPIVELASGRVSGMEAFVRWTHPERGVVAPEEFIPVAERSDLITRIDSWVLETAAAQLRAWLAGGLGPLTLAVNLSPRQFQRPDLVAYLSRTLGKEGLPPASLAVELTETAAMHDPERSVQVLSELRALGIGIGLDDFGTGYSSLSQLQRLPIDTLKLDRSFVAGLTTDPADAAIAGAILALARSLNLRVVAEGVETEEQLDFLRRRGCHSVQGFLVGAPAPAAEFAASVRGVPGLPAALEA